MIPMSFFELPKPSLISADSATGVGLEFHPDSGYLSRTVHVDEKPEGEAAHVVSYRLGVLPSGEVLASYDVHLPAGTASISLYDNGGDELGADFSIQAADWSREQIIAEAVFAPGLRSTVVKSTHGLFGCIVQAIGDTHFVELFSLNPDKSIKALQRSLRPEEQEVVDGLRIRHNAEHLLFQIDKNGYKSGITLPFAVPNDPFRRMQGILQLTNPLEFDPQKVPISQMGASIRLAREDIYRF